MSGLRRDGLSIQTPPTSPVACQSTLVTWQNGQAPYTLSIHSPNVQGPLLQGYPGIQASQLGLFFVPNITDNIVIVVQDATGANAATDPFPLVSPPGRDFSCIPVASPSSAVSSSSTIPVAAASSASSTTIIPSSTATIPGPSLAASSSSTSSKRKVGLIAGVTIAAVVAIALLGIASWVTFIKKRRRVKVSAAGSVDLLNNERGHVQASPFNADAVRLAIARELQYGNQTMKEVPSGSGVESHSTSSNMASFGRFPGERSLTQSSNAYAESQPAATSPSSSAHLNSATRTFSADNSSIPHTTSTMPVPRVEQDSGIRLRTRGESESQYSFTPSTLPPTYSRS